MFNHPLRTGITSTMFLIFPLKYSEEIFFCFCFVVLINIFHMPNVQYFPLFFYTEGKYLSHSFLFLLIHVVLREFKIYEKNTLVSLSHSLKTSHEKYNKCQVKWKAKGNSFLFTWTMNKNQRDTCALGYLMTQEYAERKPFFWQSYWKTQLKYRRISTAQFSHKGNNTA